jgi:mercuric ion transport protein
MRAGISAENYLPPSKSERGALYTGGIAAILASACHHISFLLIASGFSNTRILYIVTLADRARPFLIVIASIALFISYLRIWRIPSAYTTGIDRANSETKLTDKIFFSFITILVLIVLMLPHFTPCL